MRALLEDESLWPRLIDRVTAGDPAVGPAAEKLFVEADLAATDSAESVIDKHTLNAPHLPSVDRQDYVSIGSYWWPNEQSSDGLPFTQRDGQITPLTKLYDRLPWDRTADRIAVLSTAALLRPQSIYATHAVRHLEAWFVTAATRMNPHLRHAQFVPGVDIGRNTGVIDLAVRLPLMLDRFFALCAARALLNRSVNGAQPHSTTLTSSAEALLEWADAFLDWCISPSVREDLAKRTNNIGVYYDRLVVYLALTVGRTALAKEVLDDVLDNRVAKQIEPDGTMPRELTRTRSLGYTLLNLNGLMSLAALGRHVGMDLWNAATPDGRSMRSAAGFVHRHLTSAKPWPWPQLEPLDPIVIASTFRTVTFLETLSESSLTAGSAGDVAKGVSSKTNEKRPNDARREPFSYSDVDTNYADSDALFLLTPLHPFR